jgi:hypothetical protein
MRRDDDAKVTRPAIGLDHELEPDRASTRSLCADVGQIGDSLCVARGLVMPGPLAAGSPRVPSTTGSAPAIRTPRSSSPPVPVASKATNPENASTRIGDAHHHSVEADAQRLALGAHLTGHPSTAGGWRKRPGVHARPHPRAVGPEPAAGAPARRLPVQGHAIAVIERARPVRRGPGAAASAPAPAAASRYSKRSTKSE